MWKSIIFSLVSIVWVASFVSAEDAPVYLQVADIDRLIELQIEYEAALESGDSKQIMLLEQAQAELKTALMGAFFNRDELGDIVWSGALVKDNSGEYRFAEEYTKHKGYLLLFLSEYNGPTEEGVRDIVDYVIVKGETDSSVLTTGPINIDGEWDDTMVVVVNNVPWKGPYTEDISMAFKANPDTKKIERLSYDTLRLYSEH